MAHNVMGIDPCDNENNEIFNATTQKRNVVDPRTGLFEVYVPLPSVTGNNGAGPVIDMSLFYTPTVNNNAALGDGWSFAVTTYYETNEQLTLHSGEKIKIKKGQNLESPAVTIEWDKDVKTLTVTRQDGRVETLARVGNSKVWAATTLTTDGYNSLRLSWQATEQIVDKVTHYQIQLMGVQDAKRKLLKVAYASDKVTITFWPDDASETLSFVLAMDDYALRSVKAPDGTASAFGYQDHKTCGWLLNSVETFVGLKESVVYEDNGLTFKDNPKLSALPCVSKHTLTPLGGCPALVTTYKYDRKDSKRYTTTVEEGTTSPHKTVYHYDEKHEVAKEVVSEGESSIAKIYGTENYTVEEETGPATDFHTRMANVRTRKSTVRTVVSEFLKGDASCTEKAVSCIENNRLVLDDRANIKTYSLYGCNSEFKYFSLGDVGALKDFWDADNNNPYEKFQVSWYDDTWVKADFDKWVSPKPGKPDFQLWRSLSIKANNYVEIKGLNRKKLDSRLQIIKAAGSFETACLMRQNISYYEGDDFRKGRQKEIRQGNADTEGSLLTEGVKAVAYTYALKDAELTTTTTETRGSDKRSCSETHSVLSGRLIRQVDADGNRTDYAYDEAGRLSKVTACAQSETYKQTTQYAYPKAGRVEVIEPNGRQRATEHNGRDQVTAEYVRYSSEEGWSIVQQIDYDDRGRKQRITNYDMANGTATTDWCEIQYDEWGQECGRLYSNGRQTFNRYDPITRTRIEGVLPEKTYDENGEEEPLTSYDANAKLTTYNQDGTIAKVEWKDEDGQTYQTQTVNYTHARQVVILEMKSVHGKHSISYTYDGAGRVLTERHDERGLAKDAKVLTYTYHYAYPEDWSVSDASKIEIEFDGKRRTLGERTFDDWGRVTSLSRGGVKETFTFKDASPVPASKLGADGVTVNYEYIPELGNRLAKISQKDGKGAKSFTYMQGTARSSTASEGECLLEYQHDLDQRLSQQRAQLRKGVDKTIKRSYSQGGRLRQETDAAGTEAKYTYNDLGQRTKSASKGVTTDHAYDNQGRLLQETVKCGTDSVTVTYDYDASGREASRRFSRDKVFDARVTRSYHPDGRLKSIELKEGDKVTGTRAFTYTPGGRVATCATTGVWRPKNPKGKPIDKQVFNYDALGNIVSCVTSFGSESCTSTYAYDSPSGCRLEKVEHNHADYPKPATLSYDNAGRVTQDQTGKKYRYDWLGRLVQAGSSHYAYDPMDRLMARGQGDGQYQVIYDDMQVRGEYSPADATRGRYLEAGSAACSVQRVRYANTKRTLLQLRDANGTVLISHDLDAKTNRHHAYTAYGEHSSDEREALLGFNGEYRDADNDQYALGQGYRWYSPGAMQFHAQDSLSPFAEGGPHMYGYCTGDPANLQDRTGHWGAVGAGRVHAGLRQNWGYWEASAGSSNELTLMNTILWSGIGVLAAIVTGGTSLLIQAALVGLAIAAAATAITAVAIADSNPELSTALGWVSLGLSVAGGVAMLARKTVGLAVQLGRSGMTVARKVYHKAAVAVAHRVRGWRSFKPHSTAYRARSARLDFRTADEVAEALAPISLSRDLPFASIEAGYVPLPDIRPPVAHEGALSRLWSKHLSVFDIDDTNTVVCTVTGVLGNAGYFETERDAYINNQVNNLTSLPWGSFNLGRYGF